MALLAGAGCSSRSAPALAARLPTEKEAAPEKVVVNYGPQRLRVFPSSSTASGAPAQGYLILATERPELTAVFRPLGVTTQRPAAGFIARAGSLAWVAGHVVEAATGAPPDPLTARFLIYDRDGKVGTPVAVPLPAACPQTAARPPLLQSDGDKLYALVRCAAAGAGDGHSVLLTLDGEARLLTSRVVPHKDEASVELYLHQPDADYLVAGKRVLRVDPQSLTSGLLPSPGTEETSELVRAGSLLLIVDGASSRLVALDARTLERRFEQNFATGGAKTVTRLRAALGAPERLDIVTAEKAASGEELFATSLPLSEQPARPHLRLRLGGGLDPNKDARADHELVAVSSDDGGGVLLVYTHRGNTGPQVALRRLTL